jgi:hypothetical protein
MVDENWIWIRNDLERHYRGLPEALFEKNFLEGLRKTTTVGALSEILRGNLKNKSQKRYRYSNALVKANLSLCLTN